jgi:putative beta-lysine N-acetyltransferase
MVYDKIEKFAGCLIQHGPLNCRIYLMHWSNAHSPDIIEQLDNLAKEKKYTKIFAKVPGRNAAMFTENGYRQEASIPDYFCDNDNCLFLAKYFSKERAQNKQQAKIDLALEIARKKANENRKKPDDKWTLKKATHSQAEQLSQLYKEVFPSYPFPIDNPDYIKETMDSHIDYYYFSQDSKIIAAASAEKDDLNKTAEMTDFATLPQYRGQGLARLLLEHMHSQLKHEKIHLTYTVARAVSVGMNVTFARCGYIYGGTLINNTWISGNIESMNVWYRY